MKFKYLLFSALISVGLVLSPSLWAATVNGYSLDADSNPFNTGDIIVYQSGSGNAVLQSDDVNLIDGPSHTTLFANVDDLSGYSSGFVANSDGTFAIDAAVWDDWDSIFVGLKQANSYAIFELTNAIVSGTWSTTCGKKACTDLSHFFVIGGDPITPPNEVPVPAAVWLFGSALTGLFGISRKRQSAV
jgi:hypothetical protein